MSRLIDADLLKKNCKCTGKFEDNFKCVSLSELAKVIDNQLTAFDVDEVIEQLETRKARAAALQKENTSEYFEGETDAFEFAIKIVKEGGVE